MLSTEMKRIISEGALEKYSALYSDLEAQADRFISAIDSFERLYGEGRDIMLLSVPGRSEIIGNHTDHNRGRVMAGAITRDIIAVAAKNDDGIIRFRSEGYAEDCIRLEEISSTDNFKPFTSRALVAGMAAGFERDGYKTGGFDAYSTTEVLKGSGLSSSAAFEVMVGNVLNHLYNDGAVENYEIAKLAQFAENVYFGKPCGLMDQMACAVGGFVYIDFEDKESPEVVPVDFSLKSAGYSLCIVNTGGNHANLNADYASVPAEMKGVAAALGKEVLRGVSEAELIRKIPELRDRLGDRAVLRAIHFIRENDRVIYAKECLEAGDIDGFLKTLRASGKSSFEYLQNVYTTINVSEQGLSLALALTEGYLGSEGALRVHGGGFAGTIQAFVPEGRLSGYVALLESVFGRGSVMCLGIRSAGAVRLF